MSCASTILTLVCLLADTDKPDSLIYSREANGTFLKECEITTTTNADGKTVKSRTDQGKAGSTTLTLRYDAKNRLASAEVLQESSKGKKTASLAVVETKPGIKPGIKLQVKRGGLTDFLSASAEPIVATAADVTDILQLVRRFDAKKEKEKLQEFQGIWLHPTEEPKIQTWSIERVGADTITLHDRAIPLDRFRIKVRSGEYLVWAEPSGQVCKMVSLDRKSGAMVLKGYEEAARDLAK